MATYRLHPSTLDPPALSSSDTSAAGDNPPCVLLELKAYVAKRDNATTAFSRTWDGKLIQVTLCRHRPPRVSYVCVHSPDVSAEIHVEPRVLAAEDDLALLTIRVGSQKDVGDIVDYYVYQADDGSGRPSLAHLPRPPKPYFFNANNVGVLRYRTDDEKTSCREYIVAGLYRAPWGKPAGQFGLCLYDSKRGGDWKVHDVSLSKRQWRKHGGNDRFFYHKNCKVVAIGGDAGTMAFVDLWRGILFCDVLGVEAEAARRVLRGNNKQPMPLLRYVAVPEAMQKNRELDGDARLYRDIAVVGDRLKYVELQLRYFKAEEIVGRNCYYSDGWMASTWSRPTMSSSASSDDGDRWREDTRIMDSRDVKVRSEMCPKVWRDEGIAKSPFRDLNACQPVLGLQEDGDIVYFTTKIDRWDADAWVVAVDMRKKELLGVDAFDAQRYLGINFAYVHARISKHMMKSMEEGTSMVCEDDMIGSNSWVSSPDD